MNTEAVLAAIVPAVARLLKALVEAVDAAEAPTLYDLEAQTHAVVPQIGQVLVQALVDGQAAAVRGADRACGCGGQAHVQGEQRPLTVATSLGEVEIGERAAYRCATCRARSYPVDAQFGLGLAGRMSRYQQEQVGWLLALLPVRLARETLVRFDWPAVSASSVREHGEALGAELETRLQEQFAAQAAGAAVPLRQVPAGERLYGAPDGVMYCTTDRDEQTGQAQWHELKVAAVYEAEAEAVAAALPEATPAAAVPVRQRIQGWLAVTQLDQSAAAPDRAVRVT